MDQEPTTTTPHGVTASDTQQYTRESQHRNDHCTPNLVLERKPRNRRNTTRARDSHSLPAAQTLYRALQQCIQYSRNSGVENTATRCLPHGPPPQNTCHGLTTAVQCWQSTNMFKLFAVVHSCKHATATAKLANTATRHHHSETEEWPAHKHPSLQHTNAVIVAADITHASLQHQHNDNTPYSHVHNARHQHERGLATQRSRHHTATRERTTQPLRVTQCHFHIHVHCKTSPQL